MSRYILLVIAWIFLLIVNIILWVNNGSPNIVALGFLAVLSIVPVVDWLKIGNWFEFGKKGRHVKDEATARDERIISVGQQINLELTSEEAARAFAERLIPYSEPKELTETEELTKEDKEAITFIYNVDQAIASLLPLLRVLYIAIAEELSGLEIGGKEWKEKSHHVLDKDILFLMQGIKEHAPKVFNMKNGENKFVELFEPVEKLIKLRSAIDEEDAKPPPEKETKALVSKVYYASGYITGMFSVGISLLFVRGSKTNQQ